MRPRYLAVLHLQETCLTDTCPMYCCTKKLYHARHPDSQIAGYQKYITNRAQRRISGLRRGLDVWQFRGFISEPFPYNPIGLRMGKLADAHGCPLDWPATGTTGGPVYGSATGFVDQGHDADVSHVYRDSSQEVGQDRCTRRVG